MKKINHSRNSIFSFFSWLLPLGLTFFATPYIVRGLGSQQYGLYVLMTGFIAYSFTFNVGRAVTKYVVEFNATGEKEKISQIISATFILCLVMASAGSLFIVLISEFLVKNVLLIDESVSQSAVIGFYLVAAAIWLLIVGQVYIAIVQATHRFDIYSMVSAITNVSLILGNVCLVWYGAGFVYLVGWNVIIFLFNGSCFYYFSKKLLPDAKFTLNFGRDMIYLSLKYGLSVAGYQLFANLLFIYERIVVTRVEGTEKLTNYVVPMTFAVFIHSFVASFTTNLMAYSSELFAKKKIIELEIIYKQITKIVTAIVVFSCVSLAVGSNQLLTNWIDAKFAAGSSEVFILQLITFGLLACMIISWNFIEGFGSPHYNTISGFSWFIISIPLLLFLTNKYGIWGAGLARLTGEITIPLSIALIERKIFGKVLYGFWLKVLLILSFAATISGTIEHYLFKYLSVNWFYFVGVIFVSGLAYSGVLLITSYFSKDEKLWLGSLYKKVLA